MKPCTLTLSRLSCLASSLLLSACDMTEHTTHQLAATQAWFKQAQGTATRQAGIVQEASSTSTLAPSLADVPEPAGDTADPFALAPPSRLARPASPDAAVAAVAAVPALRSLGVMLQGEHQQAVLELDGTLLRLSPGQALPKSLGKVLRISQDEVHLLLQGASRHLPVGVPRSGTRIAAERP